MCKSRITVGLLMVALLGVPSCMEVADEEVTFTDEELALVPDPEDEGLLPEPGVDASDPAITPARLDCPAGMFCLWQHVNYNGRRLQFSGAGCQNLGGGFGFNDEMSSWYNRSGRTYFVYWHSGCGGSRFVARSGAYSSRVGGWNDEASAICSGVGCP